MPVKVAKKGDKFRIVESSGKLARNKAGTPVDGGGHINTENASKQARAINRSLTNKLPVPERDQ